MKLSNDKIWKELQKIKDPELGLSIVDLGLIRELEVTTSSLLVKMTLTNPSCPYGPELIDNVTKVIEEFAGGRKYGVEMVWSPPWSLYADASFEAKAELGIWD